MSGMRLELDRIVGVDDWLVFATATTGKVVYTIVELYGDWLDTPHRGEADFGTPEAAEDWRYIIERVRVTVDDSTWLLPSEVIDVDRLRKYDATELDINPPVTVQVYET